MGLTARREDPDDVLQELAAACVLDFEKFIDEAYPWGEPGTMLEHHPEMDGWQRQFARAVSEEVRGNAFDGHTPVMPVLRAVSKGHGVGGSVMAAMLVNWIASTRPHSQGVVTANTSTQLETKTWASVRRWMGLCIFGRWFKINTQRLYHPQYPESWFCSAQTCRAENSEAFAGQHAADSTSYYIFDEDSAIPEIIHTVAEGGMTDGEPMQFRFGNATRNTGSFYEACFGKDRDYWKPTIVDSRTVRFSNKALIARWIEQHGEDSDFVRVRIKGLPPRASDLQFIPRDLILAAAAREAASFEDDPLVVGVDFSGGGQAWNVVRFRRALDARSIPPIRIPGEQTRNDRSAFLAILAGILSDRSRKVHAMFCDSAYGAPYVERLKAMGHTHVHEVTFGQPRNPDEKHCLNMRAYMWKTMKDWIHYGAIEDSQRMGDDLGAPGYHLNNKDQLVLESKDDMADRGVASPDDADALALTFAMPTAPRKNAKKRPREKFAVRGPTGGAMGWMHTPSGIVVPVSLGY
jgi:hypothetical protein